MLEHLKSLFFGDGDAAPAVIADEVRLAAAALLVEAAMMDGGMDTKEREHIVRLLRDRFTLTAPAAEQPVERAANLQEGASQLFPFTKVIVDHFSPPQRIEMIEMLWEVAYADGRLHDYEASLVRRVAGLLYVSDQDSGIARRRAMSRLGASDGPLV